MTIAWLCVSARREVPSSGSGHGSRVRRRAEELSGRPLGWYVGAGVAVVNTAVRRRRSAAKGVVWRVEMGGGMGGRDTGGGGGGCVASSGAASLLSRCTGSGRRLARAAAVGKAATHHQRWWSHCIEGGRGRRMKAGRSGVGGVSVCACQ